MKEEMGLGHCGKYCKNWLCEELGCGLDDLCTGCPCNPEEDEEDEEYYEEEE
jgi:hypothetical protein